MERMPGHRHPLRSYLMSLARRGRFASVKEIMLVGAVPRQTINRWLREAKLDLGKCRMVSLARARGEALQYEERMGGRRMSAQQVRRETKQAVRRFNAAHAAHTSES